jgi:5-methylcytosine-specific restriction endonuclease McrA
MAAPKIDCCNCGAKLKNAAPPYLFCSAVCREEAKYVRYARSVHADGRVAQADVQEALEIKLAFILGGGYPERERRLPDKLRREIFARDTHTCRRCGQPGTEIDHVNDVLLGDINEPANLQVLCSTCHREKTLGSFERIERNDDPVRWKALNDKVHELSMRVHAPAATRPADDERTWNGHYRQVSKQRSALLKS